MTYDDIEKVWREGNSRQGQIQISEDILLHEIKNSQNEFRKKMFWRDIREIVTAVVMVVAMINLGLKINTIWPFLLAAASMWIAVFMVYKRASTKKGVNTNQPLARAVEESLNDIREQIKLVDSVPFWYLLPFVPGFAMQLINFGINNDLTKPLDMVVGVFVAIFYLVIFIVVYYLNTHYAKKKLQLREKELQELRSALED